MSRPTSRLHLAAISGAVTALTLAGCGGDTAEMRGVTNAGPARAYAASSVCKLLPVATVQSFLPGAEIDTSLPTPDSCFYGSDLGDAILTLSPGKAPAVGDAPASDAYDVVLSDATNNGADDLQLAPSLGDDGRIAVNAADFEITAVWRRGDDVYDLQFSGWDGRPSDAISLAKDLARAVTSPN